MNRLLDRARTGIVAASVVIIIAPQTIWAKNFGRLVGANSAGQVSTPVSGQVVKNRGVTKSIPQSAVNISNDLSVVSSSSAVVTSSKFRSTPDLSVIGKRHGTLTKTVKLGDAVSLNPQPLPPKGEKILHITANYGDAVSLNPQPLPPKDKLLLSTVGNIGDKVSLNPQPLPPKGVTVLHAAGNFGDAVSLNPQPLPPKDKKILHITASYGDTVSLNPQPLPPKGVTVLHAGGNFGDAVSLNPQPLPPRITIIQPAGDAVR